MIAVDFPTFLTTLSSPLLRQLLFTLRPLPMEVINDETTHQDAPRHFLRTDTTADFSIFSSSANAFLRYLHPGKNPNPENPDVKTTAHLVPLLGHIKGVLVISMMTNAACLLSSLQKCIVIAASIAGHWSLVAGLSTKAAGKPSVLSPPHVFPMISFFFLHGV